MNVNNISNNLNKNAVQGRRNFSGYFEIDQKACRAAYGLKDQIDWIRELSQDGKRAAMEGIGRVVAEGNRLAAIENKEDAISAIAEENHLKWDTVDLTWGTIPLPSIRYHPAGGRFVDISI